MLLMLLMVGAPRLTRRLALRGATLAALGVTLPAERACAREAEAEDSAFVRVCYRAGRLFEDGKYAEAEEAWRKVAAGYPRSALAWQNLATVELITTAGALTLDELPATGDRGARIEVAIEHFRRAAELAGDAVDPLALNNEGNALGLLGRFDSALAAYRRAANSSGRDFESIPRANVALTLLQLGSPAEGEREASAIVRRDPSFLDGFAILATCRWVQGDKLGAEEAYRRLCTEPTWCSLYARADAVAGRWPPTAVAAWGDLLQATRAPRSGAS